MQIDNSKVLALITARGGSKGLPRKNLLQVRGKPLIAWTIEAALESKVIDQVILSSDDDEIIKTAIGLGCSAPFRRPNYLANDTASSVDVVLHALDQLPGFDIVILLQPTSPLRTASDIDAAFYMLNSSSAPSCVSVCEVEQSPYWMFSLGQDKRISKILHEEPNVDRRQDLPKVYVLNGAIYIAKVDWLKKMKSFISNDTCGYIMSRNNSIDIDTANDFEQFCARVGGQ
jgi:CMP-N-acetylneuraminic acid synthetase